MAELLRWRPQACLVACCNMHATLRNSFKINAPSVSICVMARMVSEISTRSNCRNRSARAAFSPWSARFCPIDNDKFRLLRPVRACKRSACRVLIEPNQLRIGERLLLSRCNDCSGSGTVLHFTAMSGGSMTDTGPSCPNCSCALLSRHSVDLLQRRQSTPSSHRAFRKAAARRWLLIQVRQCPLGDPCRAAHAAAISR